MVIFSGIAFHVATPDSLSSILRPYFRIPRLVTVHASATGWSKSRKSQLQGHL